MDNLTYILCILALISVFVFIALDELLPKRLPLHKLRFPRYGIGVGLVGLAVVLLLIPEVYPAVDWEEFKMNPSLDKRTLKEQYEILKKEKLRLQHKKELFFSKSD